MKKLVSNFQNSTFFAKSYLTGFPGRLAVLLFCLGLGAVSVLAQSGLDPTFGSGGLVTTDLSGTFDYSFKLTFVQPDGKILVIGSTGNYIGSSALVDAALLRYNLDGILDATFGNGQPGIYQYTNPAGFPNLVVNSGAVQADGKIVIVAVDHGIHVLRVNANGTPDTGFGTNGVVNITGSNTHRPSDQVSNVVIQTSGKIVIATDNPGAFLIRLNTDGTVDNSFGPNGNGSVLIATGGHGDFIQQPDGKLLYGFIAANHDMNIARYSVDGATDSSFGTAGVAIADFGNEEVVKGLAVQPDGKIIAAGSMKYSLYNQAVKALAMTRFSSGGAVDISFGNSGKFLVDYNERVTEEWRAVALEANGNIIAGGSPNLSVMRISPTGAFLGRTDQDDNHYTFGISEGTNTLAIQADGKILVAGGGYRINLARFNSVSHVNIATMNYDLDADSKDDVAVYRPGGQSVFYGFFSGGPITSGGTSYFPQPFGITEDIIVPGDYNGDRATDFAVFRPSTGTWYNSIRPDIDPAVNFQGVQWGLNTDIPAPGDFDGDGTTDRAVFRPSSGTWYILRSSGGYTASNWGINGDRPMPADYDGDGFTDLAVVRDVSGQLVWYILQSSNQSFVAINWGQTGDKCLTADFNGDEKADITVYRPSNANWYTLTNYSQFTQKQWGTPGDLAAPFDYDGDNKADYAVYRQIDPIGFRILTSQFSESKIINFGLLGDRPIAGAYVR
ncbi:MAG: FG-GAP-like repeat-containing protein [Pyrinomonadaceae bacterium]